MLNRDGEGGRKNEHTTDLGGQSKQLLLKRKKKNQLNLSIVMGFPGGSVVENLPAKQETQV